MFRSKSRNPLSFVQLLLSVDALKETYPRMFSNDFLRCRHYIDESYIPPKGINQTFELALWLPCFADVDAEYERLSKLGLSFPTGAPMTFSFGIRNFYVTDPEGNLLEIGSTNEQ